MLVSDSTYLDALFLLLGENTARTRQLVGEFLDATAADPKKQITTPDDELVEVYKDLIKTVLSQKITVETEGPAKMLLLRINSLPIFKNHPLERDILSDVLQAKDPITPEQINEFLKKIRNAVVLAAVDDTSRRVFAKTRSLVGVSDTDAQEAEIAQLKKLLEQSLKNIEQKQSYSETKASESYVSMSDLDSIGRALDTYMERSVKGVIKTGLQGLNRALGDRGGIGLGETMLVAASSHNYKTGLLVSCAVWAVIHNDIPVPPGKKALVYLISLENEVHQNLMSIFKTLYCRTTKQKVDLNTLSSDFIKEWIYGYFQQFNVEFFVDRYTPHEFSYGRFKKRHNAFVDMGYQMILCSLDYMSEARGIDPGDNVSPQGTIQLIKENYTKFVNDAKQCGYALCTGHQLTKRAEEMAGNSGRYPVKRFNPSMVADSSDVFRAVDIWFFLQLENNMEGTKFLTYQNRKNRGNEDTPESHKFGAYAFTQFGIEDDLGGPPQYVTDIDAYGLGGAKEGAIEDAAMF